MKIFNEEAITLLKENGRKYISTFKEYEYKLRDTELFNNEEEIRINKISFINCFVEGDLNKLDPTYGTINIDYEEKEMDYCSRTKQWETKKIELPSWILSKSFNFEIEKKKKFLETKEWENRQRVKEAEKRQLKELAKKLGYEIKEIGGKA